MKSDLKSQEQIDDQQVKLEGMLGELQVLSEKTNDDSKPKEIYALLEKTAKSLALCQELESEILSVWDNQKYILLKAMENNDMIKFSLKGKKTPVSITDDPKFNVIEGKRKDVIEFFRENGRADLVYETFNEASKDKFFREEFLEKKKDLPSELVKLYPLKKINGLPRISRHGSKTKKELK